MLPDNFERCVDLLISTCAQDFELKSLAANCFLCVGHLQIGHGKFGFTSSPITFACGTTSRSNPIRFASSERVISEKWT